ncbi:MAG: ABC1 kinase family protein [Anaerolineae bacterium]
MSSRFSLRLPAAEILRARRIAEVLIRNGLGVIAEGLGLTRFLPSWRARRMSADAQSAGLTMPQRLRKTLEELGPTFIKLGQILSTRPDILPPDYTIELSKLLDAAPPAPASEIVEILERELGGPLDRWFATFDQVPIASASIGQVHRATLLDGSEVVVKVQRPGVQRTIQADLNLLAVQARFLEARSTMLKSYGLVGIVDEFAQALRDELDYTVEGRNADRLRRIVVEEGVVIPEVFWNLSTRYVITLTDLAGIKLSDIPALKAHGYDLRDIAQRVAATFLRQVFVHGVFHADPHPANILVCDGRVGLVDFGVVGYLSARMREDLGDLLFALVQQNADEMVTIITRIGAMGPAADRDGLRRDVQRLIVRYYSTALESLPVAEILEQLLNVAFRHQVRMPADLALLVRTVVVLEGVVLSLDPSLVLAHLLEPFVVRLVRERLSLKRSIVEGITSLRQLEEVLQTLPRRVDLLAQQLERGDMTIGVEIRHLQQTMRKADAVGNRLAFSVIVAGIIIGSALVLSGTQGAAVFRLPFTDIALPIAQIGFVAAGLLGTWLLLSIVRSRGL